MSDMKKVIEKAKKRYIPSKSEISRMNAIVQKALSVIEEEAIKFNSRPMLCGSVAKNTWLPGRNEFDIFLLFDKSVSKEELKKKGLEIGKKAAKKLGAKWKVAYAEHPYSQLEIPFQKSVYKVDVVPCYDIPKGEKIKSAVDRTPNHVRYIKSKLSRKMTDDVRLLKQFCIASGCYGADMKTLGFSGYLCELLILKYGSFSSLLKNASEWMPGVVVDIEGKASRDVLSKFKAPLIVIDPVDHTRNVAAAVSPESFFEFIKAVRSFIKRPSLRSFEPKFKDPLSINEIKSKIKKRGTNLFLIEFKRPNILEDILWSQMRRACKAIEKNLSHNGFRVLRKDCWADEKRCVLIFEMSVWTVPKVKKHSGPDIFSSKQSKAFLTHYKRERVFIEGNLWAVETEREYTDALSFLKKFASLSERQLKEKGIPSHITSGFHKSKILSDEKSLKRISNLSKEFRSFLREYFDKNLNILSD